MSDPAPETYVVILSTRTWLSPEPVLCRLAKETPKCIFTKQGLGGHSLRHAKNKIHYKIFDSLDDANFWMTEFDIRTGLSVMRNKMAEEREARSTYEKDMEACLDVMFNDHWLAA